MYGYGAPFRIAPDIRSHFPQNMYRLRISLHIKRVEVCQSEGCIAQNRCRQWEQSGRPIACDGFGKCTVTLTSCNLKIAFIAGKYFNAGRAQPFAGHAQIRTLSGIVKKDFGKTF